MGRQHQKVHIYVCVLLITYTNGVKYIPNEGLGGVASLSLELELSDGGRGGEAGGGTCATLVTAELLTRGLVAAGGGLESVVLSFWPL